MSDRKIYVAGGCFWGMENLFRVFRGVVDTEVGYMGGATSDPTYERHTGHAEALEVTYDSQKVSQREIFDYFFRIHNPTTPNQQGNDVGVSYRSAIFYQNDEEKKEAQKMIDIVNNSKQWLSPVSTTLEPYEEFFPAESYHQDYLKKKPGGYTCHMEHKNTYL